MPGDSRAILLGFLAGFLLIGVMGWKGCAENTRVEQVRASVQTQCLNDVHTPLECKELR